MTNHARGCRMREAACTCGAEAREEKLVEALEAVARAAENDWRPQSPELAAALAAAKAAGWEA